MPRRGYIQPRRIEPDPVFNDARVAKFINKMMRGGKKSVAEKVFYGACDLVKEKMKKDPHEIFLLALRNAAPEMMVKSRRVGGATYQVPIEVPEVRATRLAMQWIIEYAEARAGHSMREKLASEMMDAASGVGGAIKKKEDTHRMAEANKAFSHFRW